MFGIYADFEEGVTPAKAGVHKNEKKIGLQLALGLHRFLCHIGLFIVFFLSACAGVGEITKAPPRLETAPFTDLPGWAVDDLSGFQNAALHSCAILQKKNPSAPVKPRGTAGDFLPFCQALAAATDTAQVRAAIETYLSPWRVRVRGADDGLFTGYYEASVRAARTRHGPYQIPIRARPLDHVVVDAGAFRDDLKGVRLTGQLIGPPGHYTLSPYPSRADIGAGKIPPPSDRIIAWADSAADVFFMEVQGSGRVVFDDGTFMHLSYAERNGQKYVAIGRILVDRGVFSKEQASMQSIRAWTAAHPDEAQDLMNENPSYIFFRDVTDQGGAIGSAGVPLTPQRSMAVDPTFWSYGLPVYIDAAAPDPAAAPNAPRLQRLMVAQDTGGAIRGAIRGDVFWGAGDEAARRAGPMQSRGNMWVLLPKEITP